jgi:hypothetical protein
MWQWPLLQGPSIIILSSIRQCCESGSGEMMADSDPQNCSARQNKYPFLHLWFVCINHSLDPFSETLVVYRYSTKHDFFAVTFQRTEFTWLSSCGSSSWLSSSSSTCFLLWTWCQRWDLSVCRISYFMDVIFLTEIRQSKMLSYWYQ